MFGPPLLNGLGVRSPLARGLAFGTISTGIGTSQALAEGELRGAAAATSMALAGVIASFATPQVIPWVCIASKLSFADKVAVTLEVRTKVWGEQCHACWLRLVDSPGNATV
jgi:hypothetical protein